MAAATRPFCPLCRKPETPVGRCVACQSHYCHWCRAQPTDTTLEPPPLCKSCMGTTHAHKVCAEATEEGRKIVERRNQELAWGLQSTGDCDCDCCDRWRSGEYR